MHRYANVDETEKEMQVPSEVTEPVIFVYFKNKAGQAVAAGTAFFVTKQAIDNEHSFGYVVTAQHVINGIRAYSADNKLFLRLNKKDGTSGYIATNVDSWEFHPTDLSVDVAVLPYFIPQDIFAYKSIPIDEMVLTEKAIKEYEVNIGDEVFITGLFTEHTGSQRILPILRTGNIARMPSEKIPTRDMGDIDAYLIEGRSIGGLSGSPVFVYLGAIRSIGGEIKHSVGGRSHFYWLGIMHGHWDLPASEMDVTLDGEGNKQTVNMGIAIVVPISKILEVINQRKFVRIRKSEEYKWRKAKAPTRDFIGTEPTKSEFKGNPEKASRKTISKKPDSSKPKT